MPIAPPDGLHFVWFSTDI